MGINEDFDKLFDKHFPENEQKRIEKELMKEMMNVESIKQENTLQQDFSCFIRNNTLILFLNNPNKNIISIPLSEFYNISSEKGVIYIKTSNHDLVFRCSTDTAEILNTIHNTLQSSTKKF